jgi:hypothetical protein
MAWPRWARRTVIALGILVALFISLWRYLYVSASHLGDALMPAMQAIARQPARVVAVDSSERGTAVLFGSDTVADLLSIIQIGPDTGGIPDSAGRTAEADRFRHAFGDERVALGAISAGTTVSTGQRPEPGGMTGLVALFAESQPSVIYQTRVRDSLKSLGWLDRGDLVSKVSAHRLWLDTLRPNAPPIGQLWVGTPPRYLPLFREAEPLRSN